ncbi:MAG: circadian clock protein KaiA [Cyanobacteria bacterium RI_101]|nr:circadian clock protein KaiA [Cyanobacteria bacterium RI_101]
MQSPLYLCLFVPESIALLLGAILHSDRYRLTYLRTLGDFAAFLDSHTEHIDCLIVSDDTQLLPLFNQLYEQGRLLPVVLLEPNAPPGADADSLTVVYHNAEIHLRQSDWETLPAVIDKAIAHYLHLGPACPLPSTQGDSVSGKSAPPESPQSFLLLQQRRLADKLKERLGYLGVYYKRNPSYFYRNLSPDDKQEFLDAINAEYREIVLNYFAKDGDINNLIDQFVNHAFFADISVSQILEVHMELMDEFAQQLKLEGRNEEILLDYRLALIDILAHLGEMYRRSIPREDIPLDIYYQTD